MPSKHNFAQFPVQAMEAGRVIAPIQGIEAGRVIATSKTVLECPGSDHMVRRSSNTSNRSWTSYC